MEENKKEMLIYQINSYIEQVLNLIDNQGKLDYFNIEIKNHQGNLNMQCNIADRKKVY